MHSSHLVVICELHLSLRFVSGFGASFSFLAASGPSGKAFSGQSGAAGFDNDSILEFVFGEVSGL